MANSDGNGSEIPDGPLGDVGRAFQEIQRERQRHLEEQAADPRFCQHPTTYAQAVSEWSLRDYWTVAEAANLLCACEPLRPTGLPGQEHEKLDREVRQVQQALLRADLAHDGKGANARIRAQDVLAWACAKGVALPDALAAQFSSGNEKSTPSNPQPAEPHGNALRFCAQREAILQAAVAVIARYRHQCLDKNTVSAAAVARQIEVHQDTLFAEGEAPQSTERMRKLIARALNLWDANP